jgi:hypothetical protein
MSSARRLLRLPLNCDDHTLLGVAIGASGAELTEALRARLRMVDQQIGVPPDMVLNARRELQECVRRILLAPAVRSTVTVPHGAARLSPAQPTLSSTHPAHDLIAATILLRRDPRRAHLYVARLLANRPSIGRRRSGSALRVEVQAEAISHQPLPIGEVDSPRVRRARWLLPTLVVASLVGLVAEVIVLRGKLMKAQESALQQAAEVRASAEDAQRAHERDLTAEMARPKAPVVPERVAAATEVQSAEGGMRDEPLPEGLREPPVPRANEAGRLLRDRWQRSARAVFDIDIDGLRNERDPLVEPLRQLIALERMLAVHQAAVQLEAGQDRSAQSLLDTLPTDAAIKVPAAPAARERKSSPEDGQLKKALEQQRGGNDARLALLRAYRTLPQLAGPQDARALVQEMLRGPSRGARTLAQAILVDRGSDSLDALEAVDERFGECVTDLSLQPMIRALSGVDPAGAGGAAAARAALVRRILQMRGSRIGQLDDAVREVTIRLVRTRGLPNPDKVDPVDALRMLGPRGESAKGAVRVQTQRVLALLVQTGTALVNDEAALLGARRPTDRARIRALVQRAQCDRRGSASALGQALVNARALLELDALQLGVAQLREPRTDPVPPLMDYAWDRPTETAVQDQWAARLRELDPTVPAAYFALAEEVADAGASPEAVRLAAQLYALSATLDPAALAASSALGIAALQPKTPAGKVAEAEWRAAARRWSSARAMTREGVVPDPAAARVAARQGVVDVITSIRRGLGRKAGERLKNETVRSLFDSVMVSVPGGPAAVDKLVQQHVNGTPPTLDLPMEQALLGIELALLAPDRRRWSNAIVLGGDGPISDAPLGSAAEVFGVDPQRSKWSAGQGWIAQPLQAAPRK